MRIVNAEHLIPTAEEVRNIVQRAYDAGRARGREEAKRELQGPVDSPNGEGLEASEAEEVSEEQRPRLYDVDRDRSQP
jgi:hypothetical protein